MPLALLAFLNPLTWPSWLRELVLTFALMAGFYVWGDSNGRYAVQTKWDAYEAQISAQAAALKAATDARVAAADAAARAEGEAALNAYKETAEREKAALKHPSRECFDADDTRRVQQLFVNPIR